MFRRVFSIILVLMLLAFEATAQKSFEVNAPSVVSQGERFVVKFTANAKMENFTPPTFSGARLLAGPTPSQSSYTEIINGRRRDSFEHTYTYILEAGENSVIAISQASAVMEGQQYNSRPVTIEVVSSEDARNAQSGAAYGGNTSSRSQNSSGNGYQRDEVQEYDQGDNITYGKADLFLRLHLNKTKVVKGEPIIATLKIYTRSGIAGFEDIKFPMFNGFWSQELESPQNVNFGREKVGNQIYNSALLRRYIIIPQQTGTLTIEPAELVCQVQVMERAPSGRSILDDFFGTDTYSIQKKRLSTGARSVEVAPLPNGAPSSFGGGVGRFNMNVRLSKDSLKSNDAASVVVEISGSGNLNLMEAPSVNLPADFERYDVRTTNNFSNSTEGTQGKRLFEFPFIPRVEGEYNIEPVSYSYYDISQKRYVTLTSDTLRIRVAKGDGSSSNNYTDFASQREVSNLGEDIRYIKGGNASLGHKGSFLVSSLLFYLILLILIVGFILSLILLRRKRRLSSDVVRSKNKRANRVVRSRLKKSNLFLKENKMQDFYAELHSALTGYIADKMAIPFADMQKATIEEQLGKRGLEQERIDEFIKLLDECEMVRYSPDASDKNMNLHYKRAQELISYFEDKL